MTDPANKAETDDDISWTPLPGKIPAEFDAAFRRYSLPREIGQTNLIFYAFALFAVCNLAIDTMTGATELIIVNGFLTFVALAGASYMRRVLDYRLLARSVNLVALVIVATLLFAKTSTRSSDWFIYFADLLVITALTLTMPISMFTKLGLALTIVCVDAYTLSQSEFTRETTAGVILVLIGATVYAQITYYKMQQGHFTAFQNLQREQRVNRELRDAKLKIDSLQALLPVCANCKKVRDDDGYWGQIDEYIVTHSDVGVTHSICPDCSAALYPDLFAKDGQ
jgi:hypothetical protein